MKRILFSVFLVFLTASLIACPRVPTEENPQVVYTITFDSDGGSNVNSLEVEENTIPQAPTPPTKDGYEFEGWLLDGTDYRFTEAITADIVLVASWRKIGEQRVTPELSYTITFDTQGGTNVSPIEVKENQFIIRPANPTKDGYEFLGWLLNGEDYFFTNTITEDIVLVSKWKKLDDEEKPDTQHILLLLIAKVELKLVHLK